MESIAIDGMTGPGKRTTLVLGEVTELGFEFKRKVIKVVTRDGNMGHYDMVPITSIQVSSDGVDFTMHIESKEKDDDDGTTETSSRDGRDKDGFKQGTTGSQRPADAANKGVVR